MSSWSTASQPLRGQQPLRTACSGLLLRSLPASLLVLACLLTGCSKQLLGSLDETAANQVVSTLRREGVIADKAPSGDKSWKVTVPDEQFAEAVQLMERHNLPAPQFQGLGQVFKKESLVSTPTEERARLIHAMSQELERSLLEIDGVMVARVHPVILPPDPLNPKRSTATASVLVKYRPGTDINGRESMVRSLVAAGVEGLRYDDVRVVMVPADATPTLTKTTLSADGTRTVPAASGLSMGALWMSRFPPLYGGILAALLLALVLSVAWVKLRRRPGGLRGRWADSVNSLIGARNAEPGRNSSRRPKSSS